MVCITLMPDIHKELFEKLLFVRRRAWSVNACLSVHMQTEKVDFRNDR